MSVTVAKPSKSSSSVTRYDAVFDTYPLSNSPDVVLPIDPHDCDLITVSANSDTSGYSMTSACCRHNGSDIMADSIEVNSDGSISIYVFHMYAVVWTGTKCTLRVSNVKTRCIKINTSGNVSVISGSSYPAIQLSFYIFNDVDKKEL